MLFDVFKRLLQGIRGSVRGKSLEDRVGARFADGADDIVERLWTASEEGNSEVAMRGMAKDACYTCTLEVV